MDVVHLPILAATTPLTDAVKAMRIQQRSAVLRETPSELVLVKIAKIFRALGQHQTKLSNVNITTPVYRLTPADISSWHLDTRDPRNTWADYENFLDSVQHSYALIDSFLGSARIVTRHEGQAGEIDSSPKDCYCNGPYEHSFPPPSVTKGPCPQCSGTVHCE
jgi:hypothetical protein